MIGIVLYTLLILVLQTVVFPRLSIFGAFPDLILVSVVLFAVLEEQPRSTFFAAGTGFLQDVFSYGIYTNTIFKIVVCSLVGKIKESFIGNEYSLVAGLVVVFTPLVLIFERGIQAIFFKAQIDLLHLFFMIILTTIYNLVMVPIFSPIMKRILQK